MEKQAVASEENLPNYTEHAPFGVLPVIAVESVDIAENSVYNHPLDCVTLWLWAFVHKTRGFARPMGGP